jgi:hypothetical protein
VDLSSVVIYGGLGFAAGVVLVLWLGNSSAGGVSGLLGSALSSWAFWVGLGFAVVAAILYGRAEGGGQGEMAFAAKLSAGGIVSAGTMLFLIAGSGRRYIVKDQYSDGSQVNHPVGEWFVGPDSPPADYAGKYLSLPSYSNLWIGQDGRWSTSKVSMLAWTYVLVWALLTLVIADSLGVHSASDATTGLIDGLSFQDNYLLLLGGPFAAAVLAKAITSTAVDNGDSKPNGTPDPSQVVTNDQGQADIGDFQYFAFNLVALVYFFVRFTPHVAAGLPVIPDALVGLTSVSALAYIGKKAVSSQTPSITDVEPKIVTAGQLPADGVVVYGQNLGNEKDPPDVRVGTSGNLAGRAQILSWGATGSKIVVPKDVVADQFAHGNVTVTVTVVPAGAANTASSSIQVINPPA